MNPLINYLRSAEQAGIHRRERGGRRGEVGRSGSVGVRGLSPGRADGEDGDGLDELFTI